MLYVLNRHRNLMADPVEAVQNLREIEAATHLHATGLVDNAHLKDETDEIALRDDDGYAETVSELSGFAPRGKDRPRRARWGYGTSFYRYEICPVGLYCTFTCQESLGMIESREELTHGENDR